jgi:acyl-CoA synthetase (AMP-forming)/AMP-acid ligase II
VLLHELALARAAVDDDAPALITPEGTWSRRDLRSAVEDLARAAATLASPGARIAIVSDSRPEVVALLLAIPAAGRVAVPFNTRLTPEEMAAQLTVAAVEAVVGSAEELGRLAPVLGGVDTVRTVVGLDPGAGDISLSALAAAPALPSSRRPGAATDPAWIIFTSGTTGRAKGAVLTAASLGAAVATTAVSRPLAADDVYLYPFPLHHVSAYNVLHALSRQRPVVLPTRPGPGVELRITGDDGRVLPPGEAGEVRVRAAQVCAGYWDDPEATAAAMVDGWLRTGDIGVLDDDQLLTIVDRAKDIIVTGGENVASREVEDVIGRHPLVGRVAVIGIPDDHWGEAVCAVVVVRAGAEHDPTTTAADIRARAGTGLARFKVPKRVVFVDELPVNAGGKVIKAELRRRVAADAAHHPDGG